MTAARVLAGAGLVLLASCGEGGPSMRFLTSTPHQDYEAQLRAIGLERTALGRDWLGAATQALALPLSVSTPLEETRYLDPARATAVAYRIPLERGQRLVVRLDVADTRPRDTRLFLDLFFVPDSATPPQLVASADSSGWALDYVALRPGPYLLRVQPELLRGGRVTVTLSARASLAFPVAGRDMAAIRSRFGASRDGGRREHHGVDIFAPRGTAVLAAAAGRVARVGTGGLGGNVVWVRDRYGRALYYAHLDRHAVGENRWVEPGDTLGFVGNTGNARTTPPHLHFGIYMRGVGPVDPHFHLYDPPDGPAPFTGDPQLVGTVARIARPAASLRDGPDAAAPILARLDARTPLELLAGAGRWYRARLPDGTAGYLDARDAQPLEASDTTTVAATVMVRDAPSPAGGALDALAGGALVPVLGRYGEYLLVQHPSGLQGWISGHSTLPPGSRSGPSAQ